MGGAFAIHVGKKHLKTTSINVRNIGYEVGRKPGYHSVSNPDIDPEKTQFNKALVPFAGGNLDFAIEERIKAGNRSGRAIRKDAVKCLELVISGDHDLMTGRSGITYLEHALTWVQGKYGKENVVGAHIHLDETTPHLHVHLVPFTPEGRLSAFELFGGTGVEGRKKLQNMRNNFHINCAERYGFSRGEVYDLEKKPPGHEDENKKHMTVAEFKKFKMETDKLKKQEDENFLMDIKLRTRKKKWGGLSEDVVEKVTFTNEEAEKLIAGYEINRDDIDEFKGRLEEKIDTLTKSATRSADELHETREKLEIVEKHLRRSDGELNHLKTEKYRLENENKSLKKEVEEQQKRISRVDKIGQIYEGKHPGFIAEWMSIKDGLNKSTGLDFGVGR